MGFANNAISATHLSAINNALFEMYGLTETLTETFEDVAISVVGKRSLTESVPNPMMLRDKGVKEFDGLLKSGRVSARELETKIKPLFDRYDKDILPKIKKNFEAFIKKNLKKFKTGKLKVLSQTKKLDSVISKAITRKKGFMNINDLVRGAVLFETKEEADKFVADIRRKHSNSVAAYEFKGKGTDKNGYGYFGSHHLDVTIDGLVCELQVMTKKLWSYKAAAHDIYNNYRNDPDKKVTKADRHDSNKIFSMGNVPKYKREDVETTLEFTTEELDDQNRFALVEFED